MKIASHVSAEELSSCAVKYSRLLFFCHVDTVSVKSVLISYGEPQIVRSVLSA